MRAQLLSTFSSLVSVPNMMMLASQQQRNRVQLCLGDACRLSCNATTTPPPESNTTTVLTVRFFELTTYLSDEFTETFSTETISINRWVNLVDMRIGISVLSSRFTLGRSQTYSKQLGTKTAYYRR